VRYALLLAAPLLSAAATWNARWISVPETSPYDYGVYHFRKTLDLPQKPASFKVRVTADNRYQLFVNGERVAWGPARGDLYHWRYETVDLARWLKPGRNVLAALVWNYSSLAGEAQIMWQTGLLVQGDGPAEHAANTNRTWKCVRDQAFSTVPIPRDRIRAYFAISPGDRIDGARYLWGWEQPGFDDAAWKAAQEGERGASRDANDAHSRYMLVASSILAMEETPEAIGTVRRAEGMAAPAGFPWRIPARSTVRLLIDQAHLTTAFPELTASGGKGATVSLRYAEALVDAKGQKGNRNEIEGKRLLGYEDIFLPDGGSQRLFRPLWWRTWRYLEVEARTGDEPLSIDGLRGIYTGYPFERRARFEAGSEEIQRILDVGWRTARLCAHETYMDCPYYEQLQYAGDTRVQALISFYMTGDGRLVRNAIEQLDSSRTAEGATYSRAPSRLQQYIPPFSLWWIGMVHDYWRYQDDPAFVKQMLPGARAVLSFFAARQQANGSLGMMPWWNFVDWTRQWRNGVPPEDARGSSAPRDLQLLLAYDWTADLEQAMGSPALAAEYRAAAGRLRETIRSIYWDSGRKLFADTPDKLQFSQHANTLAVLAEVVRGEEARGLVERIVENESLVQCSIYFRHYLHSAVNKVGLGDRYLDLLGQWRTMLARGLSTWAEQADPTRSDCHAWGASPNYELFRTVLGIDSAAPGFGRVTIRPYLGKLRKVTGSIPHPKGEIAVTLALEAGKLNAEVRLPQGVQGELEWKGNTRKLVPGDNKVSMVGFSPPL